jgi:murein DD-endopeptidase MepM/ murein hydrolase activator NlpD
MRRAAAFLLVTAGFVLGCFSTVAVLSWVGELGHRDDGTDTVRAPARTVKHARAAESTPVFDRRLVLPLAAIDAKSLQDTFDQGRDGRRHEAIDIASARGTPVAAVDDGTVKKLFVSKQGGLTVYQFDPSETYCYYYAHLDRYADGMKDGKTVRRGQTIGYVGTTGNAPASYPHLHFAIFQLGAEKRWWQGTPINPYPILMKIIRMGYLTTG